MWEAQRCRGHSRPRRHAFYDDRFILRKLEVIRAALPNDDIESIGDMMEIRIEPTCVNRWIGALRKSQAADLTEGVLFGLQFKVLVGWRATLITPPPDAAL